MNFSWEANQNQTAFDVEYYDYQTGRTISGNIPENRIQLTAPKSDYKIKFRVRAICYGDEKRKSNWTPWLEAQVAKAPERDTNFVCGKVFPDREITNLELKTVFQEGEILESKNGDTRYEMVGVSENSNGVLSGQFYMIMDCWGGAKILCDFTDTKINTDNIVLTTRFSNHPFPDYVVDPDDIKNYVKDLWLNGNSLATSTKIRDTIVIKEKFDYLYANENGKLIAVVVNNDGSTTETEVNPYKSPNQCLITDGKGDSLVIDKNGRPMGISEYRATGGNKALLNEYHRKKDSAALWYVNFLPYKKQEYAFDYLASGDHGIFATDEYYPKSGNYDFRYKSVATSTTDRVLVDFGFYPEKDSVIFKDKYGVKLKLSKGNILTFTSTSTADTNYIYAYDKNDVRIGKLIVKTYAQKKYQICLVSVNGAKLPNQEKLKKYLDEIYHQANVEFEISVDELKIDNLFPFSHGDKNRFSGYNDDQKRVLEAFDSRIKENINYLFFIPDGAETNGVAGYNPFGYNFGFIYHGAGMRTIAHELAHGIGSLKHPFNDEVSVKGQTENLMDYNDGLSLWHFQWDMLQDPPKRIFKWRFEEEEAESIEWIFPNEKCKNIFVIFSPFYTKKAELLANSGIDIKEKLLDWAKNGSSQIKLNSFACGEILKYLIEDGSPEYLEKIKIFKEQFNRNYGELTSTPIVKYFANPEGTDSEYIAVYGLVAACSNIMTLDDLTKPDAYQQEPYFFTRYEFKNSDNKKSNFVCTTQGEYKNAFLESIEDKIDRYTVTHIDVNALIQGGLGGGLECKRAFGIGTDSKNIAIYGDFKLMFNYYENSINLLLWAQQKLNSLLADNSLKFDNTDEDRESLIVGYDFGVSVSMGWDWGYDNITQLFGYSRAVSVNLDLELGFSAALEFDDRFKWVGVSAGIGVGLGFSLTATHDYGSGLIFNKTEAPILFGELLASSKIVDLKQYKHGFDVIDRKLVCYCGPVMIKTDIDAVHRGDYVITVKAMEAKNDYK